MDKCINILSMLLLQSLLCIGILYFYHKNTFTHNKEIIIVDVKKIMKDELQKLSKMELNEEQQKKALNRLSSQLKRSLQDLSLETQSPILLKDVVLDGGRDETATIYNKLHEDD